MVGRTAGTLQDQTQNGNQDYFISKYDSSGSRQWAKQFGTNGDTSGATAVAADTSGNIFAAGTTSIALANNSMNGTLDCLLAKHDSTGTMIWTKQYGASGGSVYCNRMIRDSSGDIYLFGLTQVSLNFATPTGSSDSFIMKVDSSGTAQWVKMIGIQGQSLTATGFAKLDSNFFSIGDITGSMPGNTGSGGTDMSLVKYTLPSN